MLYLPKEPNRKLWDTWMYKEGPAYHLFFLENIVGRQWDRIGHAVTTDFLTWQEYPTIPICIQPEDKSIGLTGSILKDNGIYYMSFALDSENVQHVGIFRSYDLIHFEEFLPPILQSPGLPYEIPTPGCVSHFRDPLLLKRDDHYEMIVTARFHDGERARSGCLMRWRSDDMLNWIIQDPIVVPNNQTIMEVADYFMLEGKHYLLFSTFSNFGVRLPESRRYAPTGTFYLESNAYEGLYSAPESNMLIGASDYSFAAYVGRTLTLNEGILLYHQIASPIATRTGYPKWVRKKTNGMLGLYFFEEMKKQRGELIRQGFISEMEFPSSDFYSLEDKKSFKCYPQHMTGGISLGTVSTFFPEEEKNTWIDCDICAQSQGRVGLFIGMTGGKGTALCLDYQKNSLIIGRIEQGGAGLIFREEQTCRYNLLVNQYYSLRLIRVDEFTEVYLDGEWVFTASSGTTKQGHTGFFVDASHAVFQKFEQYALIPQTVYQSEEQC